MCPIIGDVDVDTVTVFAGVAATETFFESDAWWRQGKHYESSASALPVRKS